MKRTQQKTADHIRETARRIFFSEGRLEATLQELADEAGVNKALLHYYYKDRESLLKTVYEEAVQDTFVRMFIILEQEENFESKVQKAVSHLCGCLAEYPYIETFIMSRVNAAKTGRAQLLPVKEARAFSRNFRPEVAGYLKKRGISSITPDEFILNMMALCAYPPSVMPLATAILGLRPAQYRKFLLKRQAALVKLVLMKDLD